MMWMLDGDEKKRERKKEKRERTSSALVNATR